MLDAVEKSVRGVVLLTKRQVREGKKEKSQV